VTNLKKTVYKKHSFTIKAIQALIVSGGISTIITTSTKKILFPQALKNYGLALNPYLPMGPEKRAMHFWLQVLSDLHNRGVKDILISSIDNLNGFSEAIQSIFHQTEVQSCIVHQIRNSLKYVASKEQKEFMGDLKKVYKAATKELAESELLNLEEKWAKKYPVVTNSWLKNWDKLSTYFQYTEPIRRLIYTTNPIEGYHRQIRKVTKTKGAFSSETALLKLVYLVTKRIQEKWTSPIQNWGITVQQLAIKFEGRLDLKL
jgi:putative transposase